MKGISAGAQSIYCRVFQQKKKSEFRTSEIAHYLGSFLAVHNLGVGKRGEEEMSCSKNVSFHNRSIQNVSLHFHCQK